MPQQAPVATTYQNYPNMVQNGGFVGMPNFVNVSSILLATQTASSRSRATWSTPT